MYRCPPCWSREEFNFRLNVSLRYCCDEEWKHRHLCEHKWTEKLLKTKLAIQQKRYHIKANIIQTTPRLPTLGEGCLVTCAWLEFPCHPCWAGVSLSGSGVPLTPRPGQTGVLPVPHAGPDWSSPCHPCWGPAWGEVPLSVPGWGFPVWARLGWGPPVTHTGSLQGIRSPCLDQVRVSLSPMLGWSSPCHPCWGPARNGVPLSGLGWS